MYKHGDSVGNFWSKVNKTNDCWLWTGFIKPNGYGQCWSGQRVMYAHRYSYELVYGNIPDKMTIDHLCKNRSCVNPKHMEVVTRGENTLRGDTVSARSALKTHCPSRHAYTTDNTYVKNNGHRVCKTCAKARSQAYREAHRDN